MPRSSSPACADSGRSDQTQALTSSVDLELRGPVDPPAADLGGDLGLLDGEPAAGTGAVRPLRDVVDVA